MKFSVFVVICFVGLSAVLCQIVFNRERFARRMAKQCTKEQKLSYDVAVKLSMGDFSDDSKEVKCFLSCFAKKLKFVNDAGVYNNDEFLKYTGLIIPENIPTQQIIKDCGSKMAKSADECDSAYQYYKCFWDEIKNIPENSTKTVPFSLYKALSFDRLHEEEADEEEANE